ncbi:hypothetical protein DFH08DRAFT_979524 [Mycena albidolilacea]|uniref:Uncharacterized protein n=1 Tax=Mycena albidolilacea TaxID=1033008 RepID=A0AAD7E798_9AGAR|nr:hypothetical protein DFH08DRAFT_979524 [Mycena albidolilacea]
MYSNTASSTSHHLPLGLASESSGEEEPSSNNSDDSDEFNPPAATGLEPRAALAQYDSDDDCQRPSTPPPSRGLKPSFVDRTTGTPNTSPARKKLALTKGISATVQALADLKDSTKPTPPLFKLWAPKIMTAEEKQKLAAEQADEMREKRDEREKQGKVAKAAANEKKREAN